MQGQMYIIREGELIERVAEAVARFKKRFPYLEPDTCLVNIKAVPQAVVINGIIVEPVQHILPDHFWVLQDTKPTKDSQ